MTELGSHELATRTRRREVETATPSPLARIPVLRTLAKAADRESRIRRFFRDIRSELRKVTWPTRDQVTHLTIVVCIASGIVGALLGGIDFAFGLLFRYLLGRG